VYTQPLSWTATGLPTDLGLTVGVLNSQIRITGTPTVSGTFTVTIGVEDSRPMRLGGPRTASRGYSLTINPAPVITTRSPLPAGDVGEVYGAILTASGGSGILVWSSTTLPNWLAIGPELHNGLPTGRGVLVGPPTASGTFNFAVTVTDTLGRSHNKNFSLLVRSPVPPPDIITSALRDGDVGELYGAPLSASGGEPILIWTSTTLPIWLTIVPELDDDMDPTGRGVLVGTPIESGTFGFSVTVTDGFGRSDVESFTLMVRPPVPPPDIITSVLPDGGVGELYGVALSASGGKPHLFWSSVTLPLWLAIAPELTPAGTPTGRGLLGGVPPEAGSYDFSITVTDGLFRSDTEDFTLEVRSPLIGLPITATKKIPTGLITVAVNRRLLPAAPLIDWGDGTPPELGLLHCESADGELTCDIMGRHTYQDSGEYDVTISYGIEDYSIVANTMATVSPLGDFVIVSIGDSVASGEGNPVVPTALNTNVFPHPAYWDAADNSHRSRFAGPAQAARAFQELHPELSVTFLHLARTSAKIDRLDDQLEAAKRILGNHRVDALIISGGANNVAGGFGNVVLGCIGPYPTPEEPENVPDPTIDCSAPGFTREGKDISFRQEIRDGIRLLESGLNNPPSPFIANESAYEWLDGRLEEEDSRLNVSNIFLTEYFDPTRDENGMFAASECSGFLMLTSEWEFLHDEMVVGLASAGQNAIEAINAKNRTECGPTWHYVGGIAEAFRTHGYCTEGSGYVVQIEESLLVQQDTAGTAHPNQLGHEIYRDALVEALTTVALHGRPTLCISRTFEPEVTTVTWENGVLESAPTLDGPWQDVMDAESPWELQMDGPLMFYRVRGDGLD